MRAAVRYNFLNIMVLFRDDKDTHFFEHFSFFFRFFCLQKGRSFLFLISAK